MTAGLSDIDATILCGGLGTRLGKVLTATPKVLAPINGRPLLEYMIDWLAEFGVLRTVLCVGYLADRVRGHLAAHPPRVNIELSVEAEPLGTAGALRLARPLLRSDPVLVLNGDSFVDADLGAFLADHRGVAATASLLCPEVDDVTRFGRVATDINGNIRQFSEKGAGSGRGLINGGVYLFSAAFLDRIAAGNARSLEIDVFARENAGTLHAFAGRFPFIDIGTPESLSAATAAKLTSTAHSGSSKVRQT